MKKLSAALLALLMLAACAACAEKQQEPEKEQQIAGADWRTWGWVNDAESISQGQRQLLTIARVLLNNPAILILDEATSSVDTRTELAIGRAMDALMRGRTSFVIAHRLSTIVDADLILVMDHGNIIEQGTHKELLAAEGAYADLYLSQFA